LFRAYAAALAASTGYTIAVQDFDRDGVSDTLLYQLIDRGSFLAQTECGRLARLSALVAAEKIDAILPGLCNEQRFGGFGG
jgi:hypothetical protein